MKQKELLKRIEELEKEVERLKCEKQQVVVVPVVYPQYPQPAICPQYPTSPWMNPVTYEEIPPVRWEITC